MTRTGVDSLSREEIEERFELLAIDAKEHAVFVIDLLFKTIGRRVP